MFTISRFRLRCNRPLPEHLGQRMPISRIELLCNNAIEIMNRQRQLAKQIGFRFVRPAPFQSLRISSEANAKRKIYFCVAQVPEQLFHQRHVELRDALRFCWILLGFAGVFRIVRCVRYTKDWLLR